MIKIITDSSSNSTPEESKALGIGLMPLTISFGTQEFRDGIDISCEEFYEKMQIPKAKSEGLLRPVPSQIRKVMERMQNIKCVDNNTFEIVQAGKGHFLLFDTSIYSDEIEKGYKTGIARNRIESYYEKYHNILGF